MSTTSGSRPGAAQPSAIVQQQSRCWSDVESSIITERYLPVRMAHGFQPGKHLGGLADQQGCQCRVQPHPGRLNVQQIKATLENLRMVHWAALIVSTVC